MLGALQDRRLLHNHQRINLESSVGWGGAITLQQGTGERIWECPPASSAASLMALSSPRTPHWLLVSPPCRSPRGCEHFLFYYVPRPVLGWVPEEKYWLFRMNQAREGAPMSIGTGLLEPHLWVPKSQGTARSSSTGLHVTFPSFCSPV